MYLLKWACTVVHFLSQLAWAVVLGLVQPTTHILQITAFRCHVAKLAVLTVNLHLQTQLALATQYYFLAWYSTGNY